MTHTPTAAARVSGTIKALPTQDFLLSILSYDKDTGLLHWKARSDDNMNGEGPKGPGWSASAWNARLAGKEAFTCRDRGGYRTGRISGTAYLAHRIVWKMVHGIDPEVIDHINGDTGDNRIVNLRDCTNTDNSRNYRKHPGKTSKYRGVCWVPRDQKWAASISLGGGAKKSLGYYASEIEAAKAYDRMARQAHGEFATLNFANEDQIEQQ